jgi:hypothetical protein
MATTAGPCIIPPIPQALNMLSISLPPYANIDLYANIVHGF